MRPSTGSQTEYERGRLFRMVGILCRWSECGFLRSDDEIPPDSVGFFFYNSNLQTSAIDDKIDQLNIITLQTARVSVDNAAFEAAFLVWEKSPAW
jgi:hypothetical protein